MQAVIFDFDIYLFKIWPMDFSGWEKLSLVDYDDNLTMTLFMAGCNMRCPFCHNSDLVLRPHLAPKIPWEEIVSFLKKRQGVLDAVCISGGEPTLMPDLEDKIKEIKSLGYKIKLDTNGSRPDLIAKFHEEKLVDHFAMDIKNSKERYGETIGVPNVDLTPYEKSVEYLIHSGAGYEFRTTSIMEFHDEESFRKIGEWIKGAKKYFIQRYIDSENCISHGLHPIPKEVAIAYKKILEESIEQVLLRGYE